jgi:hypothetical protein
MLKLKLMSYFSAEILRLGFRFNEFVIYDNFSFYNNFRIQSQNKVLSVLAFWDV